MTTREHEINRTAWDARACAGYGQVSRASRWLDAWHNCTAFFRATELAWLGNVTDKKVCVLGSGDNIAVFALAGMGADVTSVDISGEQLRIASERAGEAGANIRFVRADVTDLGTLADETFDIVYTGGHVSVWVSDLGAYYREAVRILAPGGQFIINEYHPFRRGLWLETDRPYRYYERGPDIYDQAQYLPGHEPGSLPSYEYHWTVADYINAVIGAGAVIVAVDEVGDGKEHWEDADMTGLPLCFMVHAKKVILL